MPLHFTAFHPDFRLTDRPPTPHETLLAAYEIARRAGVKYRVRGQRSRPAARQHVLSGLRRVADRSGLAQIARIPTKRESLRQLRHNHFRPLRRAVRHLERTARGRGHGPLRRRQAGIAADRRTSSYSTSGPRSAGLRSAGPLQHRSPIHVYGPDPLVRATAADSSGRVAVRQGVCVAVKRGANRRRSGRCGRLARMGRFRDSQAPRTAAQLLRSDGRLDAARSREACVSPSRPR